MNDLIRAIDRVLVDTIRPELAAALKRVLAAGESPQSILARVRRICDAKRPTQGRTVYYQVEAWLAEQAGNAKPQN